MKAKLSFLLLIGVASFLLTGFQNGLLVITSPNPAGAAGNTFALLHQTHCFWTASATHTCTVTSTSSNSLLVAFASNNSGAADFISSITGAGTWVVPTGASTCQKSNGSIGAISCAYVLVGSSGVTSINYTMGASSDYAVIYYEYSSTGAPTLDYQNSFQNTTTTTPAGITSILTGTSDVIVQGLEAASGTIASITTYANFLDSGFNTNFASANLLNTASGTAPTWTNGANAISISSAIAFK